MTVKWLLLAFLVANGIASTWLLGILLWASGGFKLKGVGVAEANILA